MQRAVFLPEQTYPLAIFGRVGLLRHTIQFCVLCRTTILGFYNNISIINVIYTCKFEISEAHENSSYKFQLSLIVSFL